MVSLAPSSKAPIHLADELKAVPSIYCKEVILLFPLEFSTAPISDSSVEQSTRVNVTQSNLSIS